MFNRLVLLVASAWSLNSCATSLTVDVVANVGEEKYYGTSTGYTDRTGTADMISPSGKRCIGQFRFTGARTGMAIISCDNGERGQVLFNAVTRASGYGNGVTDRGTPIQFSYGPDRDTASRYLTTPVRSDPAPQRRASSTGTGFYVSAAGHVVTNAHVVDKCGTISLRAGTADSVSATVVAKDDAIDLAILSATARPSVWVRLRGETPRLGEPVTVFGFPVSGVLAPGGVVTTGVVSATTGPGGAATLVQITAQIQPGSSGSPIFDGYGRVMGVVVASANVRIFAQRTGALPQNVNFAINNKTLGTFLAAHSIPVMSAPVGAPQSAADVAATSGKAVVLVTCE